jgi:hypothetical protein
MLLLLGIAALAATVSRRRARVAAIACAAGLATAAGAQAPAGANGAMTFPHVRVVNAPSTVTLPWDAAGLRAAIDPATGRLVEPSHQDAVQLGLPPSAARMRTTLRRSHGLVGARLDPSMLNYTVVRQAPNGRLQRVCAVGDETADALVHAAHTPSSTLPTE